MTEIKLTHYNAKGKAETCRLILAHAGKKYEDKRITVGRKCCFDAQLSVLNPVDKLTYQHNKGYI